MQNTISDPSCTTQPGVQISRTRCISLALVVLPMLALLSHAVTSLYYVVQDVFVIAAQSPRTAAFASFPLVFLIAVVVFLRQLPLKRLHASHTAMRTFALLVSFVAGAMIINSSNIRLEGDYKRYFESAVRMSEGQQVPNFNDPYDSRAVPYFLPVLYLTAGNLLALQYCNLALMLFTSLLYARLGDLAVNRKTGTLCLCLFLLCPALYVMNCVASHDVPANFFLSLFLLLCLLLNRSAVHAKWWKRSLVIAICVGGMLAINDLQRGTGLALGLGLLLNQVVLVQRRPRAETLRHFLAVVVLFLSSFLATQGVQRLLSGDKHVLANGMPFEALIYSFNDLDSDGSLDSGAENFRASFPLLSETGRCRYVVEKYVSAIAVDPWRWAKMMVRKSRRLLSNNTYIFSGLDQAWKGSWKSLTVEHPMNLHVWYTSLLYILVSAGLFAVCSQGRWELFVVAPLLMFIMVLVSEVNPQYSFVLLPPFACIAAIGLNWLFTLKWTRIPSKQAGIIGVEFLLAGMLCVLGLTCVFATARSAISFSEDRFLIMPASIVDVLNGKIIPQQSPGPFGIALTSINHSQPTTLVIKAVLDADRGSFLIESDASCGLPTVTVDGLHVPPLKTMEYDAGRYARYSFEKADSHRDMNVAFSWPTEMSGGSNLIVLREFRIGNSLDSIDHDPENNSGP